MIALVALSHLRRQRRWNRVRCVILHIHCVRRNCADSCHKSHNEITFLYCSQHFANFEDYYYYYYYYHHKAAGRKTRLDIQNYGCIITQRLTRRVSVIVMTNGRLKTVSECCLIKSLPCILFERCIYISAVAMASPGNRHCASCIGTVL